MRLIGLHGRLHGGKDTAFETIDRQCQQDGYLCLRRAFADPLKTSGLRALGYGYEEPEVNLALANKIKETGRVFVTWDEVSPETGNIIPKSLAITGREFWQNYGTEAHREADLGASFGPDFWVDNMLPLGETYIETSNASGEEFATTRPLFWDNFREDWAGFADIGVVTDVRFPNEAKRILELGGEVWYIDADIRLGENTDAHASEVKLPDDLITHTVDNNGTVAQFQQNVLDVLHS